MRRFVLIFAGLLCLAALARFVPAAGAQRQAVPQKPNVVLIITDDIGYGDIGSYGAPDVKTPNIDSLAKDGTRLTDFYAAPTCTPTRAALISGRYQQRYRLEQALGAPSTAAAEQGLPATGTSLPQLLRNNGYATALVGKWHLGYLPAFSPNAHGFDYFFGFKSGGIDYYEHTAIGTDLHDLFENDLPAHVDGYMTDLITQRAVRFIEQNASRSFFIDVSYNAAHWPWQLPDKPSKAADRARMLQPTEENTSTRQDYVAILEHADKGVGQILATVKRLGLAQNTLVIFTNDNGGEWLSRNAPLFHRKKTVWEGGVRVPAIVRWPGHVPAGQVSPQVGIVQDLTASILAATGSPVPADAKPEGINLLPILERRSPIVERTLFFRVNAFGHQQKAVRQGEWKLMLDGQDTLLFNLSRDLGERDDLAQRRPDIARKLRPLLAAWERDVDEEAAARQPPGQGRGRGVDGRPGGPGSGPGPGVREPGAAQGR
jgi:arylsulfatase A-like enzyme